jgi:polyisoprenoid-binding protein YceI
MRLTILCLLVPVLFLSSTRAQNASGVPVFKVTRTESKITFAVEASEAMLGAFDKWDATMAFTSGDPTTAVLDIEIQANSVSTGSDTKNDRLKGNDFFDVKDNPLITFKSTKVQNGPNAFQFEVEGNLTIRGVTKPEKLLLTVSGGTTGGDTITGTMGFHRKDYGMNSGIPFLKFADRVEVTVSLLGKRISGPPMVLR